MAKQRVPNFKWTSLEHQVRWILITKQLYNCISCPVPQTEATEAEHVFGTLWWSLFQARSHP